MSNLLPNHDQSWIAKPKPSWLHWAAQIRSAIGGYFGYQRDAPILDKPSLVKRIAIGKIIGLLFGLAGFFSLPSFYPEADWLLRWGILLWYPTLGAIIGIFGVFTWHPVLKFPMPWWVRAPLIGAWMNFVLTFFAYDVMDGFLTAIFGDNGLMTSPFWFVVEGAFVGLVIGCVATWIGGEGESTTNQ